jgi:putative ABC transport system permease protein
MAGRGWAGGLRQLWRRRRADEELDAELALHLDLETQRHIESGATPAEARRRARIAFGGLERHREAALAVRSMQPLDDLGRDLVQGMRALMRTPAHALTTVLALGLGIGAATAMFSVVDGVLLRPLGYGDAERLHLVYESQEAQRLGALRTPSYPSFLDWERELTTFESLAYIRGDEFRLRGESGTERLLAGYVSHGFFRTLGAQPLLGRVFGAGDDDGHVVVLSHGLWQRRFGGDPDIIGRTLATADASFKVVGVMPAGFRIPSYADVWAPLSSLPPDAAFALTQRDLHVDSETWALVREGVSQETARAELAGVVAALSAAHPEHGTGWTSATLTPARDYVLGDVVRQLRILIAAVALILLIVCVNVAGLQLARGSARARELGVRAVLGASRGRLIRQLLTESLLLSAAGGVLGVLLAIGAVSALSSASPAALPRLGEVAVDTRVLLFAVATSLLAALGSGVLPALRGSSATLSPSLREGAHGASGSVHATLLRQILVVAQVALALVLTVGSGLLLRSLLTAQRVDLGFESAHVAVLRVFPPARYGDADAAAALYRELQAATRRVPGVRDVALSNHVPFAGGAMITRFVTGDEPPATGEVTLIRTVSQEYFDVLETRLLRGRLLSADDFAGVGGGIVINDVIARDFFGTADPVGRNVTIYRSAQGRPDFGEPIQATVVGVVQAERYFRLEANPPRTVYVPWTWMVWPNISVVVRTAAAPEAVIPALRTAVQGVDADIPVAGPGRQAQWQPLTAMVGGALERRRLMTVLLGAFAGSALALAVLGVFGVTQALVARRTREIGIRVAIGAPRSAVARLVLGHAARLVGGGIVLGLAAAWAGMRLLRSELYGVGTYDPVSLGAAILLFAAAGVVGAALPTRRALHIHPAQAVRAE